MVWIILKNEENQITIITQLRLKLNKQKKSKCVYYIWIIRNYALLFVEIDAVTTLRTNNRAMCMF